MIDVVLVSGHDSSPSFRLDAPSVSPTTDNRSWLPDWEDAPMASNNVTDPESVEPTDLQSTKSVDDQLIDELVGRSQAEVCN
ncbi:hypothetical protein GCM10010381_67950 [Streptomyces xantholiticus]|nr:hypothetical protein GCM10010381_67950 [Streptomyces xantholiticus]